MRIITPIIRRVPYPPCRTPEPRIQQRCIEIYRLDDIINTIDIFITYNLNRYLLVLIFLNIDGSHILIDIFGQHCLQ